MRLQAAHQCVRFKETGSMRLGQLKIEVNGQKSQASFDQTLWKCVDCGTSVWLESGVDPNVKEGKAGRLKRES